MPGYAVVRVILIVGAFLAPGTGLLWGTLEWPVLGWGALLWWLGGVLALDAFWPKCALFGKTLVRGRARDKVVALTFDDGPSDPATGQILEILDRFGVKATFFMLGANALRHPELVRRVRASGHAIGNHGFAHEKLHWKGPRAIRQAIRQGEEAIARWAPLSSPRLFRPPHGFKNPWLPSVVKREGYHLIGWTKGIWDVDPGVSADLLFKRATQGIRPGEILLLHDGQDTAAGPDRRAMVAVLPRLIEFYRQAGYRLVTIPELLS